MNNERNGKGKEYYENGKLKFEGEYINGLRNGKGVEYYDNGTLKFVGEYLNDNQWNGEGYYSKYGNIYNLKEGKGFIKEYFNEQKIFEGEYKNGEKNGYCKEYYKDGMIKFEGQYFYGKKWTGDGYDANNNIKYKIKEGRGYVKTYFYYTARLLFEGEYINGEINGKGKEYDENGRIKYEGEYLNGLRNGKGKEYYKTFLIFEGVYLYGHKLKGKEYYFNGKLAYEGEYLNDKKWDGKG